MHPFFGVHDADPCGDSGGQGQWENSATPGLNLGAARFQAGRHMWEKHVHVYDIYVYTYIHACIYMHKI